MNEGSASRKVNKMHDYVNALRGGYRRDAFIVQYNLILLFGAVAFSAATASWVPLAVGLFSELAWLVGAPWFPAFRRWIDARRDAAPGAVTPSTPPVVPSPASAPPASTGLDGSYGERVKRLELSLREIRASADEELRRVRSPELSSALATLPALAASFERLCVLHHRLSRFVAENSSAVIELEISRLTDAFSKEKDLGLRVTLRQARIIAQKRLEQHGRIVGIHRASTLRLDMIENAAAHVRSSSLTMTSPEEFAGEIRGLATHITTVSVLEEGSAEAPSSRRGPGSGAGSVAAAAAAVTGDG